MKVNVELDRLEKMVEAYLRQARRDWDGYDGDPSDWGKLQAYRVVLDEIQRLKSEL